MIYPGMDQDQPDSYCCVPTTASMGCDAATAGVKRPAVEALRKSTGVPHPYGISYIAITGATKAVANTPSEARFGLSRSQVVNLANSGRPWGISIWAGVTYGTIRATGYFRGGHTIFCPPDNYRVFVPDGSVCTCDKQTTTRHSEFRIQDPGTFQQGFVQISADLLFRAAEERTRRANSSGINVLTFPDTSDVYRKGSGVGYIRTKPSSTGGRVKQVETRPYHVLEIVKGEPWFRKDGSRSTGWYRVPAGYIRGDRLGYTNVVAP